MDTNQWLVLIATAALSGASAWVVAMWWYRRKLAAARARVLKLEKARQISFQQTTQARKQLEQLQREIAELRQPTGQREVVKPKPLLSDEPPRLPDNPLLARDQPKTASHGFAETRIETSGHGFAETQIMEPAKKRPA